MCVCVLKRPQMRMYPPQKKIPWLGSKDRKFLVDLGCSVGRPQKKQHGVAINDFAIFSLQHSSFLVKLWIFQPAMLVDSPDGNYFYEMAMMYHGNPQPSFLGVITHILGVENLHFSMGFWGPRVLCILFRGNVKKHVK